VPNEDAIQYGRLGLCEAAQTYDPEKSDSFKGWASYYIRTQVFRGHYRMASSDALDQPKKKIAEFDDFRYYIDS
jgi:DNA-directed RNA polymerase specialized sigma subunit